MLADHGASDASTVNWKQYVGQACVKACMRGSPRLHEAGLHTVSSSEWADSVVKAAQCPLHRVPTAFGLNLGRTVKISSFLVHAGYVAISKGDMFGKNRDIVIVFRGTVEESEWWSDFQPEMVR